MIGRVGTAPCGHDGEAIIGQYYRCLKGCDAATKPPVKYVSNYTGVTFDLTAKLELIQKGDRWLPVPFLSLDGRLYSCAGQFKFDGQFAHYNFGPTDDTNIKAAKMAILYVTDKAIMNTYASYRIK